jgi:deazaflavin-dependent oxidoreductase (nitroreductase family)
LSNREKPAIPPDMKAFNRTVIDEYRKTDGKLAGGMTGRHFILLTTTGARSGEPRTVVLGYGRDGDDVVVIASNNGAVVHPKWYLNLLAKPNGTVEVGGVKFEARARTAKPEERDELAKAVPYLESQQKLTQREIPLVVLERIDP